MRDQMERMVLIGYILYKTHYTLSIKMITRKIITPHFFRGLIIKFYPKEGGNNLIPLHSHIESFVPRLFFPIRKLGKRGRRVEWMCIDNSRFS